MSLIAHKKYQENYQLICRQVKKKLFKLKYTKQINMYNKGKVRSVGHFHMV